MRVVDLTGQLFGSLRALRRDENASGAVRWMCACVCGVEYSVAACNLKSGHCRSCGCVGRETRRAASTTHGLTRTREYQSWNAMKSRCENSDVKEYRYYGGRGIRVCDRWRESFEAFLADMGPRPAGTTLDRFPNGDGNYEPGNCRWATDVEQARNRRGNRIVAGATLAQVAETSGIARSTIKNRLARGWSVERATTEPVHS